MQLRRGSSSISVIRVFVKLIRERFNVAALIARLHRLQRGGAHTALSKRR